jgi:leader peptidase (prepilin peptidase)/N-methyltransferase
VTPWFAPLIAAPFVGSFLGVLIRRLPLERPVAWSRSACEHCGTPLGARDLVPLVSYAAQRGRCRQCGAAIGFFHPAIELAALAVAATALPAGPDAAGIWANCALGWTLLACAWIDWEHFLLPDVLTLPLLVLGLVVTAWDDPDEVTDHAIGAVLGYAALRLVSVAYVRLRGREGMGAGDAKLLAAGGAWLGWAALPWVVVLAAGTGLLLALGAWLRGERVGATTMLPFGPCLALAIWLLRLWGGVAV